MEVAVAEKSRGRSEKKRMMMMTWWADNKTVFIPSCLSFGFLWSSLDGGERKSPLEQIMTKASI